MSFNDGFSSRGVDYISGSDGEVLTRVAGQWVAAPNMGSGGSFSGVTLDPTNPNLEGLGTPASPLKVKANLNVTSVTASFSGDGSQLTNLPLSNYSTKADVTGAIQNFPTRTEVTGVLLDYATLTGVSGTFATPLQVTSSLQPYATLVGVSSSFARLDLANTFTSNQTVSGFVSSSGGFTGSLYGFNVNVSEVSASNITASDVITNYINFKHSTDPAWDNGRLWYNNTTHELNYWTEVNGFNVKLGQQLVQRCQNDEGVLLSKGKIVHLSGTTSSDTPRIKLADWSNDGLSANTLGLVAEDIAIGGTGYVIVQGILKGINTTSYNPGQLLYLSSSGQITTVKPTAPKHTVSIGQVIRSQTNNGSIYVSVQNGYEIGELHDVSTNGKSNNDLLIWDSTIPAWKNSSTLGGYTFSGVNTFQNSITGTTAYFNGNVRINGTASISHLDTLEQNSLKIGDKYITILSGGNTHVELDGSGLLYGSGSTDGTTGDEQSVAYVLYRNSYDKLEVFPGLRVSGSLTASAGISGSFVGDGSGLVNIPANSVNLSGYATNAGVTSSFAALNSANTFNADQTITGSLFVSSNLSASQITGSFSGDGSGLVNISSGISLTTNGTSGSATLVGGVLNIPKYINIVPPITANEIFRGMTARNNSTATDTYGGLTINTTAATTAQSVASTNYQTKQIRLKYGATVVSTGRYTGIRDGVLWYLGGGFRYVCGFGVTDTSYGSGCRQFYGMSTSSADLTYTDTITVESLLNIIGIGSDAADTNLQIFHNDGSGASTKIDLGVNFPANRTAGAVMTTLYNVELYNPPGSSNILYKVTNGELNVTTEGVITTNLPATTAALNCFASRCMGGPITGTGEFCITRFGVYNL